MNIHIEATNHPHFKQVDSHYRQTLEKKYSSFEFIKVINVVVSEDHGETTVKLIVELEKDPRSFVKATHPSEDKAFKNAMHKLDHIVRKYKTQHYHGI